MDAKMRPNSELGKSKEEYSLRKDNVIPNVKVDVGFSKPKESETKGIQSTHLSCGDEEDAHVNIIGNWCVGSGSKGVENASVDMDLTDTESSSSSSFGDTGSGLVTTSGSACSDSEVESEMCNDKSRSPQLRKKKLRDHWRKFIGPLMWRSKWIELKMIKLNSQALKYEKELEEYGSKKQLESSKFVVDDCDVKSVPRPDGIQRDKVMKRKKRRRAEECDISSYVSSHSLFSYYENKDPGPDACLENFHGDVVSNADNADNVEDEEVVLLNKMWSFVNHEDKDKSLFDIIQNVEGILSHVDNLKTRMDKTISENQRKLRSVNQLSIIGSSDELNHSGHNSTSLASNENMDDILLTENTLSTLTGITPFIEPTNRPQLEVPSENTKDEVLVQNQGAKKELDGFENVRNHLVEKSKESDEE